MGCDEARWQDSLRVERGGAVAGGRGRGKDCAGTWRPESDSILVYDYELEWRLDSVWQDLEYGASG